MKSIYAHLLDTLREHPNRTAVRFKSKTLSYKGLNQRIQECAAKLVKLGVNKGDVVAVNVPNCLEAVELLFAINYLGAVAYFIHPLTPGGQMVEFLEETNCHLLFCLSLKSEEYTLALGQKAKVISINPYRRVNFIKAFALDHMSKCKQTEKIDYHHLSKAESIPEYAAYEEKGAAIYLNTGGTSGNSKVTVLSNEAVSYLSLLGYSIMNVEDGKGIKILTAIPMFHGFGLAMGVLTPLLCGAQSVLMLKFSSKEAIRLLKANNANVIIGVPALYNAILNNPAFKGEAASNIIVSFIGGDCVPDSLINKWDRTIRTQGGGSHLHQGYGLTETVTVCHVNTDRAYKIGSVGKPLEGIKQLILDPITHEVLPVGEEGEIAIAGPTLMNGYLGGGDEDLFVMVEEEKYLLTKDLGYIDEDGFLYFRSRLKRVAKVNGVGVCPGDLEKLAMSNPDIHEAFSWAVDDKRFGQILMLAIVRSKTSDRSYEEIEFAIQRAIKQKLPVYYKPRRIIFVDALPRTAIGKVDVTKFPSKDTR